MMRYQRKPTPPGEIISKEFLKPFALTQKELADHIGCNINVINRIINEKSRITPLMATKLGKVFDTTPDFWLNAQNALDLWIVKEHERIAISSLL